MRDDLLVDAHADAEDAVALAHVAGQVGVPAGAQFELVREGDGVADVVGERTNGRGSIQQEFRLAEGDVLMISTKLVHRAGGAPLQSEEPRKSGLSPDVPAPERDFISNFFFEQVSEVDEDE
ncbi:MAG: hypothetical protein K6T86_21965, partial [Pirellulales bacterium]|nr:hypothetical protein [Pirellulales bacterium]